MYFYLSKTLGDLAIPSNFITLLILVGLLAAWRGRFMRAGRRLVAAGVVLLLVVGYLPVGTALLVPLENRFPRWDDTRGPPTGVVVLGGVVNTYISATRGEISLNTSANRLIAAVTLYRRYPDMRIVFAGGNSNLIFKGLSEAPYAARFLESLGVPTSQIAIDRISRNTAENAVNSRNIAAPKPGERWLLITSAAHMPRAIGLFREAGFPVEAYPVDYRTGGWRDLKALPPLSPLSGLYRLDVAVHEWEGLIVDWVTGRSAVLLPGPADASRPNGGGH